MDKKDMYDDLLEQFLKKEKQAAHLMLMLFALGFILGMAVCFIDLFLTSKECAQLFLQ